MNTTTDALAQEFLSERSNVLFLECTDDMKVGESLKTDVYIEYTI